MCSSFWRGAATLALVASLCGCANNPYIAPAQPVRPASTAAAGTMDYALQYADNLRQAYYAKLPEEFLRERNLSGGLMTLAVAGIAAAAGGAHRDVLLDMALAGALAYQLGTWDTSRSRQDIYLQGMKAVTCAKVAIAPLRLQPGDITDIRNLVDATNDAIEHASHEAGLLARWVATTPGSGGLAQIAQDELTAYDRDFRQASQAVANAGTLQRDVNQAGNYLELQLNRIEDSVTGAVNGTRADLRNLPGVIGDIASYAAIFQPGLQVENFRMAGVTRANRSVTTAESRQLQNPPAAGVQLPAAYAGLREWRANMVARTDQLARLLVTATPEQVKASLANCGVDTSKLSGQLSVSPAAVPLVQGGEDTVQVFGGTPPYNVTPAGTLANGLTIRLDPPATVTVKASATAALGDHQITVRDAANTAAIITVTVQAAAASGSAPSGTAQSKHLASLQESCPHGKLPREQVCFLQSELGVATDGLFGPQTCDAVRRRFGQGRINQKVMDRLTGDAGVSPQPTLEEYRQYLQRKDLLSACKVPAPLAAAPAAGAVTEARPGCVLVAPNRQCRVTGARCEFECTLSEDQVVNIGRALGLTPPPKTFDNPLRAALADFQKKRGLANKLGDLTVETAEALPPVPR